MTEQSKPVAPTKTDPESLYKLAADLVPEAMAAKTGDPVTRAELLAAAQIYATLATVRPSLAGMVQEALLREAELEAEGHRERAGRLQGELDEIRRALEQYGHLRDGEELVAAVERLMERAYNEGPEDRQ